MLVLSRKLGEEIVIDGRIRITVTALDGGRVKLGITAPREVSVYRGELAELFTEVELHREPVTAGS